MTELCVREGCHHSVDHHFSPRGGECYWCACCGVKLATDKAPDHQEFSACFAVPSELLIERDRAFLNRIGEAFRKIAWSSSEARSELDLRTLEFRYEPATERYPANVTVSMKERIDE